RKARYKKILRRLPSKPKLRGQSARLRRPSSSAGSYKFDGFVFSEDIKQMAQCLTASARQGGVARKQKRRIVTRGAEIFPVYFGARYQKTGPAALPRSEQVTFATQSQVLFGDTKAILGLA